MRYVYVLVLAVLDQRMGNSTHHVAGRYPTSPAQCRNGLAVVDLLSPLGRADPVLLFRHDPVPADRANSRAVDVRT